MDLNTFSRILHKLQETYQRTSDLYKLDIDVINFSEKYDVIINILMSEIFNTQQMDLIEWWLYEKVDKYLYDFKTKEKTHDLTKIEDLYNYIMEEKNFVDAS